VAVLVTIQVRHVRSVKAERGAVLDGILPLFSEAEVSQDGIGFPSLSGRYDGERVKLELVVDALALRELPRLWLVVTVLTEIPLAGAVDIVLRPRTSDVISPGTRWRHEHAPPARWPDDIRVVTREPGRPAFDLLACALPLLEDPDTKALTLTPRGVRAVQRLASGEVGSFRVTRRAKFEIELERARMIALLDAVIGIAREIEMDGLNTLEGANMAAGHIAPPESTG
jgi:hypothetical protein